MSGAKKVAQFGLGLELRSGGLQQPVRGKSGCLLDHVTWPVSAARVDDHVSVTLACGRER